MVATMIDYNNNVFYGFLETLFEIFANSYAFPIVMLLGIAVSVYLAFGKNNSIRKYAGYVSITIIGMILISGGYTYVEPENAFRIWYIVIGVTCLSTGIALALTKAERGTLDKVIEKQNDENQKG